MSSATLFTMVTILTIVWGGFFLALYQALRREHRKRFEEGDDG